MNVSDMFDVMVLVVRAFLTAPPILFAELELTLCFHNR